MVKNYNNVKIKFGTDGWRDKITGSFTYQNVKRAAEGVARYLVEAEIDEKKGIAIGYDTRKYSGEFANIAAETISGYDIPVYLNVDYIPTPALSHAIKDEDLAGAVMITASHNPPEYNGFKFFPHYGGPAIDYITERIEALIPGIPSGKTPRGELIKEKKFEYLYKRNLSDDLAETHKKLKVVVDSMHGAGSGYLSSLLEKRGHEVYTISERPASDFNGKLPEPIDENLQDLKNEVLEREADLGLALDGDADRFGVISQTGRYVSPNEIFAPVADYLTAKLKIQEGQYNSPGELIFAGYDIEGLNTNGVALSRTIATTHAIDKIAMSRGVNVIETLVGFKYLSSTMVNNSSIMGAEESGGLGIYPRYPEKDGIAASLFITKMLEEKDMSLCELLKDTEKKFGAFVSKRIDLRLSPGQKEKVLARLKSLNPPSFAGREVVNTRSQKGLKVYLNDGSWFLVRPSGTEDLVRIYGESDTEQNLEEILDQAQNFLEI